MTKVMVIEESNGKKCFAVGSESGFGSYYLVREKEVDNFEMTCTCAAFVFKKPNTPRHCKHIEIAQDYARNNTEKSKFCERVAVKAAVDKL